MQRRVYSSIAASLLMAFGLGGANCIDKPIDEENPRDRFIAAYSTFFSKCYSGSMGFIAEVEPGYASLLSVDNYSDFIAQSYDRTVSNPNVDIDEAQRDACIEALESAASCEVMNSGSDIACNKMFVGKLEAGATCAEEMECAGDSTCEGLTESECGECKLKAGLGESCVNAYCVEGSTCNFSNDLCEAPAQLNESCEDKGCADGLECDLDVSGSVCIINPVEDFHVGDSCNVHGDRCDMAKTGLACKDDDADGTGVCAQVSIADEGEACELLPHGEFLTVCRFGLLTTHYCDVDLWGGQFTGTCKARPSVGEACSAVFEYCNGLEAYCDEATIQCMALTAQGASCDPEGQNTCGVFANCDEGVCASYGFEMNEPPVCE